MKIASFAPFLLALSAKTSLVAAQGGKKGAVTASTGGKKGMPSMSIGGKKGMSMSMSTEEGVCAGAETTFCNSNGFNCENAATGCKEEKFMDGLDTANECLAFCADNMEAESYFVTFNPTPDEEEVNLCDCYESCLLWVDDSDSLINFGTVFAVGDAECTTIPIPDEPSCPDTPFVTCTDLSGLGCDGEPGVESNELTSLQECVDFCWAQNLPVSEYVAFNDNPNLCSCYENDGEGAEEEECDPTNENLLAVIAAVDPEGACPQALDG